ncbi:MAG: bifunctional diaminohydroxyphosphoribosylaminopyrimidine deaminase/5-amino-6-(5-phosphoribosylamino)uracil reductase RibD, partial [Bacteroidales bacterium]|nr:bifunctional diaminohydroxyphosphoribosylaminopyrimidine deaminase/5-amino-6-(5-phosphoribosylamino)uracil reductase RibD [Bacteroidales bacterium]
MAHPDDLFYMRRCLDLAVRAEGNTSPNPLVGSVIVHNGRITGEGYHLRAGTPHAEVHAINSVADKSLLSHSTLYASLEPCSHQGRTPPCTDLIIRSGIKR